MKPFLKWVGGKTQLLAEIQPRIPNTIATYHEPFLGGGSVLLAVLADRAAGRRTIDSVKASDINPALILLYQTLQTNVDGLIDELQALVDAFVARKGTDVNRKPSSLDDATSPESYYYWVRAQYNKGAEPVKASAMFLFLNKTCFRGVYREGPNGFNVPFGHYKNPGILDAAHLRDVSALLAGVEFTCQSFSESLRTVAPGDFVYLDPPYVPLNATSFVGYTADGFSLKNHEALFAECKALASDFLLSNADVALVTAAFPEPFVTHRISCRRAIHSKTPNARANEVLISKEKK
jgi:DNA adenine methylase